MEVIFSCSTNVSLYYIIVLHILFNTFGVIKDPFISFDSYFFLIDYPAFILPTWFLLENSVFSSSPPHIKTWTYILKLIKVITLHFLQLFYSMANTECSKR